MTMIYMQGWSDTATYEKLCKDHGFDPIDRKVVFLFPGNSGHHGKNVTLFSIKSGAGLATAARVIGQSGYPVLSLPTTTMENWESNTSQQATVQKAIEDLYQAFGAGYSFMLPVRKHGNKKYFDHGLGADGLLEPSFWGGVQLADNKPLANHYIKELNIFVAFMALSDEERLQIANNAGQPLARSPFYRAWLRGCNMAADDPWLKPVVKIEAKKPDLPKKINPDTPVKPVDPIPPNKNKESKKIQVPTSYEAFFRNNDTPANKLKNVRELLNDYTKNNSCISRFFHGHWNRHHVAAVHAIVKKIDNNTLETVEGVMKELKSIKLFNPNGSLAKRIYCIEEKNPVDAGKDEIGSQKTMGL